jgi:cephalosporin-C deacetylase-like acetyl esterase
MNYEAIWKSIIRPPREEYLPHLLGPKKFRLRKRYFKRKDFTLVNPRGLKLECSHFEPAEKERVCQELPCVIYLHCNAGSRLESIPLVKNLLTANITVFSFDFSGCGQSEGEYISLGWFEKEDLKTVVDYLRSTQKVSYIGLWGRSMGAVTALLYGETDPSIAAIVADSPFSSLKQVIKDQAKKYSKMPGFIISVARKFVKKTILKKSGLDIDLLAPINSVDKCYIPILFCHALSDNFVYPYHTEKLFQKYSGEKDRITVEGEHNSLRPKFFLDSVAIFFYNALQCDLLPEPRPTIKKRNTQKLMKEVNLTASTLFQHQLDLEEEMIKKYTNQD